MSCPHKEISLSLNAAVLTVKRVRHVISKCPVSVHPDNMFIFTESGVIYEGGASMGFTVCAACNALCPPMLHSSRKKEPPHPPHHPTPTTPTTKTF